MAGLRRTGCPSRLMVPAEVVSKPAIIAIRVDLPAPFGPSRPVTPGRRSKLTSLTATTFPNQREAPSIWTVAIS